MHAAQCDGKNDNHQSGPVEIVGEVLPVLEGASGGQHQGRILQREGGDSDELDEPGNETESFGLSVCVCLGTLLLEEERVEHRAHHQDKPDEGTGVDVRELFEVSDQC